MEVWIGRDGERHGPYREEQIREWLHSGQLSRDDLGWYDGLADWQVLSVLFPEDTAHAVPPPFAPAAAVPSYASANVFSYAGFWKRLVAYIIDAIVLYIPSLLLEGPFGSHAATETLEQSILASGTNVQGMMLAYHNFYVDQWAYFLTTGVIAWLYFAICESSRWQATLGKMALGIRVTDLQGGRISFLRALGRYAGKFLSTAIILIGFVMAAFTARKQALHDLLANTLVVNGRANDAHHSLPKAGPDDKSTFHA